MIRAVVPHFSMAAPILAKTDLLLTVPSVAMGDSVPAYALDDRELRRRTVRCRAGPSGTEATIQSGLIDRSASREIWLFSR
ncbi:MAG: hypothetical protein AB8G26_10695 [Ilumatobacter sp.]